MNRVGHEGRGESVWLGWFLCTLVDGFAPTARARGDTERAQHWEAAARGWRSALNDAGWDGAWFRRAFFDDGSPLGSQANAECRIDLIAQAWAVLSGATDPARQTQAMQAVDERLFDRAAGTIKLLDPPLRNAQPSAGYIQAYPPGVRENGGQYSHAGVWAVMAFAELGQADLAYRLFTCLSPAHRSAHPQQGAVYGLEPYVMAGDVYTQPPYVGRGGWSWYTGSAGWMHRAAVESICGLIVRGDKVCVQPHLPRHWTHVTLRLQRGARVHEFVVCASTALAAADEALHGGARRLLAGEWLTLADTTPGQRCIVIATETVQRIEERAQDAAPVDISAARAARPRPK
jgi:cyclic beta-1,2-glucan synthetase